MYVVMIICTKGKIGEADEALGVKKVGRCATQAFRSALGSCCPPCSVIEEAIE